MPTQQEIEAVREKIARVYGINLVSINQDAADAGKQAKTELNEGAPLDAFTASLSMQLDVPLIPDFETRNLAELPADTTIRPNQIEQNLDEAAHLQRACIEQHKEYSALAKLYLDARIKLEEFFRLHDIHKEEIAAGLFEIPYTEATSEIAALQEALSSADHMRLLYARMTEKEEVVQVPEPDFLLKRFSGLFNADTDANLRNYHKKLLDIQLKDGKTYDGKPDARFSEAEKSEFKNATEFIHRVQNAMESANIHRSRYENQQRGQELRARIENLERKAEYLKKDVVFRSKRAAVTTQISYVQLAEYSRHGSPLNYPQRMRAVSGQFADALEAFYRRVRSVELGMKQYYGISHPIPVLRKGEALDELSKWLFSAQQQVARARREETVGVYSFWLKESDPNNKFEPDKPLRFTVDEKHLGSPVLLRGISAEYVGKGAPISMLVTPPATATTSKVPLPLGRVGSSATTSEVRPDHPDKFWNLNPIGEWKVVFKAPSDVSVQNIAIHMWGARRNA